MYEDFVMDTLSETAAQLQKLQRGQLGRRVVGDVRHRQFDEEIEADTVGEAVLKRKLEQYSIRAQVFSEHNNVDTKDPDVYIVIDPLDGSSAFKRGFPELAAVAVGVFDARTHNPLCSGISFVLRNVLYLTREDGSYIHYLDNGEERKLVPNAHKTLLDSESAISSYALSRKRWLAAQEKLTPLVKALPPKIFIWPNSGPPNYALVAEGSLDAHFMASDLRQEIDPGYFVAEKAGCLVSRITEAGPVPYKFEPRTQDQRIDILVTPNKHIQQQVMKTLQEANVFAGG